jgi:hypothetical protein
MVWMPIPKLMLKFHSHCEVVRGGDKKKEWYEHKEEAVGERPSGSSEGKMKRWWESIMTEVLYMHVWK